MTFRKLVAVALIFVGASAAWTILGSSVLARTGQFDGRLEREVQLLWGGPHRQTAPDAWIERPGTDTEIEETKAPDGRVTQRQVTKPVVRRVPVGLNSTRATADLDLEHRRKGLLWYATYTVAFKGTYTFRNPDPVERLMAVRLPLPAENALFDDFVFTVNGQPATLAATSRRRWSPRVTAAPDAVVTLDVGYRSRGLGTWIYAFRRAAARRRHGARARLPAGGGHQRGGHRLPRRLDVAATSGPARPTAGACSGRSTTCCPARRSACTLPEKLNPGPFAARVTFFAPVGLLFFLAVMVILGATSGPSLHPMHYWFVAAAFFAFHLLLAYLVDHVSVHVAFGISAAVSLALVVSYLRLVTGMRHALFQAGAAQAVFLVLFSYAFFFEGFTGLAITIGAVITLFALMQITARVSWDDVFAGGAAGCASCDGASPWQPLASRHDVSEARRRRSSTRR